MAKEIKLVSGPHDKKFKHIERILQRFSRRLHKTVIGAMPPIPVFSFAESADVEGVVFRWMSPVSGVVTGVCLYINEIEGANPAEFMLTHAEFDGNKFVNFSVNKRLTVDKLNIPVSAGSRLILSTTTPDLVSNVWVAFLLEVGLKDMKKEVFLIDEFEKVIGSEIEEDEDA